MYELPRSARIAHSFPGDSDLRNWMRTADVPSDRIVEFIHEFFCGRISWDVFVSIHEVLSKILVTVQAAGPEPSGVWG